MVLTNWNEVKDRLFFDLLNVEDNKELLENVPHGIIGKDIAVVYKVLLGRDDKEMASVTVNLDLVRAWDVSPLELHSAANRSAPRLNRPVMTPMQNMVEELGGEDDLGLYVLTNDRGYRGASVIVYPGLLAALTALWGSGFWIIPSSIHEVMLLKADKEDGLAIANIVRTINKSGAVEPGEVLSDHPLYFNADTRELEAV